MQHSKPTSQIVCFNHTPQRIIGQQLYQKNNALRNFANVMEHPEFSTFFNEYLFKDPVAVVRLMRLYAKLGQTIHDPYEKLAVFNAQMQNFIRASHEDQQGQANLLAEHAAQPHAAQPHAAQPHATQPQAMQQPN